MRNTKKNVLGTVAVLGMAASAHAQQAPAPANHIADENKVVVTAQKREQFLQEVPVSVNVMNAQSLANAKLDTGTEIARLVANLRVSTLGDESQPKFSLRGISSSEFNLNAISPTGAFFDEVYVGAQYLGGAQIFDVERVEVLRGPQGTLFGKNTTAGAVNFISRKPTFRQQGELTLGVGSNNYREAKGMVEVPLIENRLSARLAFTGARSDGYIKNVNPAGHDLSNIERKAMRLTLGYKGDDGLTGTLRLFAVNNNPEAIGATNEGLAANGLNANGKDPRVNPFTGARLGDREVATDRSGVIEVRGSGGYLTLNKSLDFGTITSITSFLNGRFLNLVDADGTMDPLLHIDFRSKTHEFSQDLRFSSSFDGPFQFIAGVYHQRDNVDIGTTYTIFGGPPVLPILGQRYHQERRSHAAYVDGTYDVDERVTVYGGLRYTRDEGDLSGFHVTPIIPVQPTLSYSDAKPTGRLGASMKVTRDLMVYGHYARGYRSSAFNGGALTNAADLNVAKPEYLNSFEVGVKSQVLDRKLTLNASAFRYDFKQQQFLNVVGISSQQLVNAGQSQITGAEFEAMLQATRDLRFNASVGLLDGTYRSLLLNGADLSGKRMIEAPRYTANAGIDYNMLVAGGYKLSFHGDASLVGEQYFLATNAPKSRVGVTRDVAARVALLSPSKKVEVAVYGKNLSDNRNPTGIVLDPTSQTKFTTVPYPRRYGVDVTFRY
ncbi:TonB-dependent receptor [Pseudoduganella namucuonensis]|uniref:Iron complex outermembrane recepter protein n=1 Tax=Pseudoduganella namucuonensis TaxID=1035707 RepID=A0A1I7IYE7_9BURK|nr:TonB-dependent receptor [Pseudoduganella namucuonensis]SFU77973.1 iron complex outermembrane recepter protein [Pseudoduganella namucuonensis]